MELLWSGGLDVMCIASNDSDFSPLALRLTRAGVMSVGTGNAKAPAALRSGFQHFIDLDAAPAGPKAAHHFPDDTIALPDLARKLCDADPTGSVALSRLGSVLRQELPEVSSRVGSGKLLKTIRRMGTLKEEGSGAELRVSPEIAIRAKAS